MRLVLITIADAANRDGEHAHPGLAAMIEGSLYGRRHVLATVKQLVDDGWLEVEEEGGGRGRSTVYRVVMETVQSAHPLSEKGCNPGQETVQSDDSSLCLTTVTTSTVKTRVDGFEEFWQLYPLHKAKAAAQKAWAGATRKVDPEVILEGLRRYVDEQSRPGAPHTAYPATWLNAERWDDEPAARPRGQRVSVGDANLEVAQRFLNERGGK